MAIYCGVDIAEVDRIKNSIDTLGENFIKKIFTAGEIEYCEARKSSRYMSYAARFAAKEAVSKALGTGISGGISLKNIEVVNDGRGRPNVILTGAAKELYDGMYAKGISLSLSHTAQFAVAYALIEA